MKNDMNKNEYLYHTTNSKNIKNIRKEGLKKGKGEFGEGIYFGDREDKMKTWQRKGDKMIRVNREVAGRLGNIHEHPNGEIRHYGFDMPASVLEMKHGNNWKAMIKNRKRSTSDGFMPNR